ncbi:MAG: hypothetical protein KF878_25025 [Planctomycetes bacterium]|nr:hypothetical protein [Planctomycetota bacterium]
MGGTNGGGGLGTLLAEALADEERRLAALEARLVALRGGPVVESPASDSTQAIWASLAERGPSALGPAPAPMAEVDVDEGHDDASGHHHEQAHDDDADDWAALAAEAPPAPPASGEDDPRLEAARRLLAESGQGLQELRACLSRAPGWEEGGARPVDDADDAADADDADDEQGFWSADDQAPAPRPAPARERAPAPRPRDVEPARFGLDRAFRGADAQEPAWAQALRQGHGQELEVLGRVEELLIELGKTVAAVLERSRPAADPAAAEVRAQRAEQERDALREEVAARAVRIARLEALVEQVLSAAPADPSPPTLPALTPRGTRRPPAPSEALRRALLASPEASSAASRQALEALRPVADEERAALRRDLLASGARQRQLVEEQAALLERLARLL